MPVMRRDDAMAELELVYRHGYPRFVRLARALTGSAELAHDVVQDAFAAAVRSRKDYRGDGPLEAWLWRIVVNKARLCARERATTALAEDVVEASGSNGSHGGDVLAAVAALPERQRLVVFLRYYADLDYRSIAAALGVGIGTVSATLHAAHASLRRALEEVSS
jgi:RNA polymerase sigma-70 factor, ECF subfamily